MPTQRHQGIVVALICILACGTLVYAQEATAPKATLTLSVNDKGLVGADVSLALPADSNPRFYILMLPIGDENRPNELQVPADVRAAEIGRGRGYTLVFVACPSGARSIRIAFQRSWGVSETLDGKGKLELDLSYPFVSATDRLWMRPPNAIGALDIRVLLPGKYDDADIATSANLKRVGEKEFACSFAPPDASAERVWLSFPNPSQRALNNAKWFFSLVVGLFLAALQLRFLRDRRLSWFLSVCVLSCVVLGLAAYYIHGLARWMDFLVYAAYALPTALYAAMASIYLAAARRYQATITGPVTVNGVAAKYVTVTLIRSGKQGRRVLKVRDSLEAGRYVFYVWVGDPVDRYQVSASYYTQEVNTDEFSVTRGSHAEVPVINLQVAGIAQPAAVS